MTRRRHSQEFKNEIVNECIETGNTAVVARKYDLSPSMVGKWVRAQKANPMQEMTRKALKKAPGLTADPKEAKKAIEQNTKLKKLIGEKELEIEILRDLLKKMQIPLPPR